MRLYEIIDDILVAIQQQAERVNTILLHPRSRYRSVVVARLLQSDTLRTFYYALGPDDIDLPAFLTGITHDLANQHPTFGRHLLSLMPEERADATTLMDAFVADVNELSAEPFLLIFDEYDRSDYADDIQLFIERFMDHIPSQCKLLINSRTLPRVPWISLIARQKAAILEDGNLVRKNFYISQISSDQALEVFALGPGFVLLNDKPIDSWEGHLPRLLFFFALDRPVITRSEICNAFWPELDIDQAVNVFHVTKRRLHKALDMDVLVHNDGYYRINPALDVRYDVSEFVSTLMDGRDGGGAPAWQGAIDLYRGPFLQGHADRWIVDRRADYQIGYLEALTALTRIRANENRTEQALALTQRALSEAPNRQDLHRQLMRLFTRLGRRSEAAAHYQHLERTTREQHLSLDEETQAVYAELMV